MSDYGADKNPNIPAAQDLAYTKGFMPLKKTNVMQWTYPDDVTVRKLANKTGKSNALFKFAPPPPPPVIPPDLPPVPARNPCTECWGDGKAFGVGETPQELTVVIQNIEKGPNWMPGDGEPIDGTFPLFQNFFAPCVFQNLLDDYLITLVLSSNISRFIVTTVPVVVIVFFEQLLGCQTFFTNTITDKFINGTATIFIPPIS